MEDYWRDPTHIEGSASATYIITVNITHITAKTNTMIIQLSKHDKKC
jgi:hypothetical protein